MGGTRQKLMERATLALGRLDSISVLLPDTWITRRVTRLHRELGQCPRRSDGT